MPCLTVQLATIGDEGPIELFPDPTEVFAEWTGELAARLFPVARFDLGLGGDGSSGTGVFLYYEDVACMFLEWTWDDGRIVSLHPAWRDLRPLRESPSRDALARRAGGARARLTSHAVEVPTLSSVGEFAWASAFEAALRADGAANPLARLRLGGHPCFVQSGGYVDDETFVTAELPTSALGLDPMYLYLFGEGSSCSQLMQMT